MFKTLAVLAMAVSFSAFAKGKFHEMAGECSALKTTCEGAGYKMGDHKATGKGLIVDCMGKIAKGEKVEGVTVNPDDPATKACIEKMNAVKAERKEKRHHAKHHGAGEPPAVVPAPSTGGSGH